MISSIIRVLITFFTTIAIISCNNTNEDKMLFLNFPAGITKDQFLDISKNNSSLVFKENSHIFFEYKINLKSGVVKSELIPIFEQKKLKAIFIKGEVSSSDKLFELENIFIEKYKIPQITQEYTGITNNKSTCMNWYEVDKHILFCKDSVVQNEVLPKTTFYFFEITYYDLSLNNKTKNEL